MAGFEGLYEVDPIWYVAGFAALVAVVLFFDRIQQSLLKHELWRSHKPSNIFLLVSGELKKINEIIPTEKQETNINKKIKTSKGDDVPVNIHVVRDKLLFKFGDGTKDTIALSSIRPYSSNCIGGSWDESRIFYVAPEADEEQYLAVIEAQKTELATLREENKTLAKASLSAVKEMATDIGGIAKSVRPNIMVNTGRGGQPFGGGGGGGMEGGGGEV